MALMMAVGRTIGPAWAETAPPAGFFDQSPAPGLYIHFGQVALTTPANKGDIANLTLIVGRDAVAVIDTGGSVAIGRAFLRAIRVLTPKPVRYVINTHEHPDHLFGNPAFADTGALFVGHANLPAALAQRWDHYMISFHDQLGEAAIAEERAIVPTLLVGDRLTLDLGDRPLDLIAWHPSAHTNCDLTVTDRTTGTLIAGDLVFVDHVPVLDGSVKGWMTVLAGLAALPVQRVIPGHGRQVLPLAAALAPEQRYLNTLIDDARQAIAAGTAMETALPAIGASERGRWSLFDDYNPRNATTVFTELEWE